MGPAGRLVHFLDLRCFAVDDGSGWDAKLLRKASRLRGKLEHSQGRGCVLLAAAWRIEWSLLRFPSCVTWGLPD